MVDSVRLKAAFKVAQIHASFTLLVAMLAAWLVFFVWFPGAYRHMAGGTELFTLIIFVDAVCGPLLTLVLFSPKKSKLDLLTDIGLVAVIQLVALGYGMATLWEVRPLYLSHEFDRFKVVSLSDLRGETTDGLSDDLRPKFLKGPQIVGLRLPISLEEKNKVLMESLAGGADFGERPAFFVPFTGEEISKTLNRSKSIKDFLLKYPDQRGAIETLALVANQPIDNMRYLPISARNNWVAVLMPSGDIAGFVPGDGF